MGHGGGGEGREAMRRCWEPDNKEWHVVDEGGAGRGMGWDGMGV